MACLHRTRALVAVAALVLAGGCTDGAPVEAEGAGRPVETGTGPDGGPGGGSRDVYVAMGASDTTGEELPDPIGQAWPWLLRERMFPDHEYVNVGVGGAPLSAALLDQLPRALDAGPDVVSIWLNGNDILIGVAPEDYEVQLTRLLAELDGAELILVGNAPAWDRFPALRACAPDAPRRDDRCFWRGLPPPDDLRRIIAEYNRIIARVVRRAGAELVDLRARAGGPGDLATMTVEDGLHWTPQGHRVLASRFAAAAR